MTCRGCGGACLMDNPSWPRCPTCKITYQAHTPFAYDSNWRDVTWERVG